MLHRLQDGVIRLENTLRRQLEELRREDAVTLSKMSVIKDKLRRLSNKDTAKRLRNRRSAVGGRQLRIPLGGGRHRIRSTHSDPISNRDGISAVNSSRNGLKSERNGRIFAVGATGEAGQARAKVAKRNAGVSASVSEILRRINELDYRYVPEINSNGVRHKPDKLAAFNRLRRTSPARKRKTGGGKQKPKQSRKIRRKNPHVNGIKLQKIIKNKPAPVKPVIKANPKGRKNTQRVQKSARKAGKKANKTLRLRSGIKPVAVSGGNNATDRQSRKKTGKKLTARVGKNAGSDSAKKMLLTAQAKTGETVKSKINETAVKSLPKENGATPRVNLGGKAAVEARTKVNPVPVTESDRTVASKEIIRTKSAKPGRKSAPKTSEGIGTTSKLKLNKISGVKLHEKVDRNPSQKSGKETAEDEAEREKIDETVDKKFRTISQQSSKQTSRMSALKPLDIKNLELRQKIEDIFRTQSATETAKVLQKVSGNEFRFKPGKKKVPLFWRRHGKIIRLRPSKTSGLKIRKKSRFMPGKKKTSFVGEKHGELLRLKPSKTKGMKIGKILLIKPARKSAKKTVKLNATRKLYAKAEKKTIEQASELAAATLKSKKQEQVKRIERPKNIKTNRVISALNVVIGEVSSVHRLSHHLSSLQSQITVRLAAKRLSRLLTSSKRAILVAIGAIASKVPSDAVHNRLQLINLYLLGIGRALRRGRSAVTANVGVDEYGRLERITNETQKLIEQVLSGMKERNVTKPASISDTLFVAVESDKVVMSMTVSSSPGNRSQATSGRGNEVERRLELQRGLHSMFDTETLAKIGQTFEIRPEVAKQVNWRNWKAIL